MRAAVEFGLVGGSCRVSASLELVLTGARTGPSERRPVSDVERLCNKQEHQRCSAYTRRGTYEAAGPVGGLTSLSTLRNPGRLGRVDFGPVGTREASDDREVAGTGSGEGLDEAAGVTVGDALAGAAFGAGGAGVLCTKRSAAAEAGDKTGPTSAFGWLIH